MRFYTAILFYVVKFSIVENVPCVQLLLFRISSGGLIASTPGYVLGLFPLSVITGWIIYISVLGLHQLYIIVPGSSRKVSSGFGSAASVPIVSGSGGCYWWGFFMGLLSVAVSVVASGGFNCSGWDFFRRWDLCRVSAVVGLASGLAVSAVGFLPE